MFCFTWYRRPDGMRGQAVLRDLLLVVSLLALSVWISRGLASSLAPLVKGYTTSFRLMEMALRDKPILRKLMLQAPDT